MAFVSALLLVGCGKEEKQETTADQGTTTQQSSTANTSTTTSNTATTQAPAASSTTTTDTSNTTNTQAAAPANDQQQASAAPAASSGGKVNVYNWSDYIGEHTNDDFTKKTGIAVQYDVFDSNETLEAKLLAGNTGYDVVVPSGGFLGRQIQAGVFMKLDKSKLPNISNIDPVLMKATEAFDPGHEYSVPYFWGTVGIGYNVDKIKQIMPDAPTDSWDLILKPEIVSKFKDCGVTMLDAPSDVLQSVLIALGKDPHSDKPEDYAEVEKTLLAVRPYIKYFHSSSYINDIANGEICMAIGWNGDFSIAQSRADEAKNGVHIQYVIPKEGALLWVDNLAIPKDATNVDQALQYINNMLDPQVAADVANFVHYASPNKTARDKGLIDKADLENPAIYPPDAVMSKLAGDKVASPDLDKLRTRTWTTVKTGQ
ncbi:MAG TPA: polyamine ABC transporter substrate-binding protein [Dongiaceae bacterium]|nr:polyamine ABC transporter substrate-binding protein [Dongiaceae bacterium]